MARRAVELVVRQRAYLPIGAIILLCRTSSILPKARSFEVEAEGVHLNFEDSNWIYYEFD